MRTGILSLSFLLAATTVSAENLKVVSSFSILGDLTQQVGGDKIDHAVLVGPDQDTHVFQPTPQDAKLLADADVVIVNGLGFEGWMDRLIEASGFDGTLVEVTANIEPIAYSEDDDHDDHDDHGDEDHADHDDHGHDDHGHDDKEEDHADHGHDDHADHDDEKEEDHAGHDDHAHDHGEFDPHAWQDAENAAFFAFDISLALAEADPANAEFYEANGRALRDELFALDEEVDLSFAGIPVEDRVVVTSHDAFQYYGQAYGITFLSTHGLGTEDTPSAKEIAEIVTYIRDNNVKALFVENAMNTATVETLSNETGVGIGGTLYPGSLSGSEGPAATYQDMMRYNTQLIVDALSSGS